MANAVAVVKALSINLVWKDPETGNVWIRTSIEPNDYEGYARLPKAVDYDGKRYGLMSWNSDTGAVWYADHKKVALPAK
jgi:hypothetical protein